MVTKVAVVAITRHGIAIARRIKQNMPEAEIYVPQKHSDGGNDINWFSEQSTPGTPVAGTPWCSASRRFHLFAQAPVLSWRVASPDPLRRGKQAFPIPVCEVMSRR